MRSLQKYEMPASADIVVYAPDKRLLLAVDVRAAIETSARDAAALRRNWSAHGFLPDSSFYLLVYPATLFLWRRETPAGDLPDYVSSAKPVFNPKGLNEAGQNDERPHKSGLQFVMFHWLSILAGEWRSADPESEPEKMLIDAGVYEQLRRGDVRFEADL